MTAAHQCEIVLGEACDRFAVVGVAPGLGGRSPGFSFGGSTVATCCRSETYVWPLGALCADGMSEEG
jgi:hypothetical protein